MGDGGGVRMGMAMWGWAWGWAGCRAGGDRREGSVTAEYSTPAKRGVGDTQWLLAFVILRVVQTLVSAPRCAGLREGYGKHFFSLGADVGAQATLNEKQYSIYPSAIV